MKTLVSTILLFLFFVANTLCANAQETTYEYKYWVVFTDKSSSNFTIENPEAFLSQRAINRRDRQNISVGVQDLPVSNDYVQSVLDVGDELRYLHTSKWFNALTVAFTDTAYFLPSNHPILLQIAALPFVEKTILLSVFEQNVGKTQVDKFYQEEQTEETERFFANGFRQINMLNGDLLHLNGFDGEGKLIAVMDSGFPNVNSLPAFQHLFDENRFLGGFDMVEQDGDLFNNPSSHGARVLSTMAASLPGEFVGTAPKASYMLFITEAPGEQRIEEINWIIAAERADSAGADILSTSLGYADFFTPDLFDYSIEDNDGNTAYITQGADIAASKGILVVNSAGNEGNGNWRFITPPSDADSVLSVGAVNTNENYVSFSSVGPSFDGRVKPEVVAMGQETVLINSTTGNIETSNGTSFSAPIIAGMAASLWEAVPNASAWEIRQAIIDCASLKDAPTNELGYGLPDFKKAIESLIDIDLFEGNTPELTLFPNPFKEELNLFYQANKTEDLVFSVYDSTGKLMNSFTQSVVSNGLYKMPFTTLENVESGIYFVALTSENGEVVVEKVIKVQ